MVVVHTALGGQLVGNSLLHGFGAKPAVKQTPRKFIETTFDEAA